MNLVLFTHPDFIGSQSQSRFAHLLVQAYRERGHQAQLRQPRAIVRRWIDRPGLAKWAGYIDQYLLFPLQIRREARSDPNDTLYVFCDQALGPWVPLLAHRPHVVHCHDLLALRSALGEFEQNRTGWSGRLYQRYIRRGFRRARHFISISRRTRDDLHAVGGVAALTSEVIYNGLNHDYRPLAQEAARTVLAAAGVDVPASGFLLHVGGSQWYKNPHGVVALYGALAQLCVEQRREVPPLWMVSPAPDEALRRRVANLPTSARVHFCQGIGADTLQGLYSSAQALLFPSLAEGFGWPIAEALACGCPVVTTDAAPMNEVGGPVATYLPRLERLADLDTWARDGALRVLTLLDRDEEQCATERAARIAWAKRFEPQAAITAYLKVYESVLARSGAFTRQSSARHVVEPRAGTS
jgi:glycosyltransferase involved in cell wall biosynthesis